jgi:hypothetical protein
MQRQGIYCDFDACFAAHLAQFAGYETRRSESLLERACKQLSLNKSAPFAPRCSYCALLSDPSKCTILFLIKGLDDVGHNLAKVEAASSSLVSRSNTPRALQDAADTDRDRVRRNGRPSARLTATFSKGAVQIDKILQCSLPTAT